MGRFWLSVRVCLEGGDGERVSGTFLALSECVWRVEMASGSVGRFWLSVRVCLEGGDGERVSGTFLALSESVFGGRRWRAGQWDVSGSR